MLQKRTPRKPWVAGLLQLLFIGLGNLYSGRPGRGLILHLAAQAVAFGILFVFVKTFRPLNLLVLVLGGLSIWAVVILDGVRNARQAGTDYELARYNRWYFYVLSVIAVSTVDALTLSPMRQNIVQAYRLSTPGMVPTLLVGDHLIADKSVYRLSKPERGDIAVFNSTQGVVLVQRIVGLPGETIEIRDRTVFVNGARLDEPYVQFVLPLGEGNLAPSSMPSTMIPADAYFLMGDNRDNSADSRFLGTVPADRILGKAGTIYFSWDWENEGIRWSRIGRTPN